MNVETILFLSAGAALGGFANGLAGFGTALFVLGFWLQVLTPFQAVAVTVAIAMATGIKGMWIVRHDIFNNPRRLARFLIPALVGIPAGLWALQWIEPDLLKLVVAGLLLIYGTFFLLKRNLPSFNHPTPVIDSGIGLAAGVLGGLAGLSGVLPAMWCALRGWPKGETRAVLQPFNFVVLTITFVILASKGAYTGPTILAFGVALAVALPASLFGIWVFKHLTDIQFRKLLIGMMFLSGAGLMGQIIFLS
jgi:uncharacterized membrane protein YfcA